MRGVDGGFLTELLARRPGRDVLDPLTQDCLKSSGTHADFTRPRKIDACPIWTEPAEQTIRVLDCPLRDCASLSAQMKDELDWYFAIEAQGGEMLSRVKARRVPLYLLTDSVRSRANDLPELLDIPLKRMAQVRCKLVDGRCGFAFASAHVLS